MIGALRHKLERLTLIRDPDMGGGAGESWQANGEIWASVDVLSPIRDITNDRRVFLKRIAASIRHFPDVREGDRVRFDQIDYEIVSIESDTDRQRRMVLICEEVAVSL